MRASAFKVLRALKKHGFEAFIVGGAVRDLLLDRKPEDFDLVTTATPGMVRDIATMHGWRTKETGKAFGVMTVIIHGQPFEVATARTECYGRDSHRPAGVQFSDSIRTDLARRDFTINAMAMGLDGAIIDPYGGREDLAAGLIRTVGSAVERFREDALRPFRALRFAAQLGFEVEESLLKAIPDSLGRIGGLAVERVLAELEKILVAPQARRGLELLVQTGLAGAACRRRSNGQEQNMPILPELERLVGLPQNPCYHLYDVWEHTLATVAAIPPELILRWAALLHDVAKGLPGVRGRNKHGGLSDPGHDKVGAQIAAVILSRLQLPVSRQKRIVWLVRNHMVALPCDRSVLIRWLKRRSLFFGSQAELREAVRQLIVLRHADLAAGKVNPDWQMVMQVEEMLDRVLATVPFYTAELKISGGDVAHQLGSGPQVGKFLADVLERVIAGRLPNSREALLNALTCRARRLKSAL
jgi:tRNA nucleotidyltransferase (CCA-adding enzyme)